MGRKRRIRVKICPICGSERLDLSSPFDGWLTPETYICLDCGYRGPIYLELEIERDRLDEDIE